MHDRENRGLVENVETCKKLIIFIDVDEPIKEPKKKMLK